jgi:2Fe-2S ferredoxin
LDGPIVPIVLDVEVLSWKSPTEAYIDEIDAECEGCCACVTGHVYAATEWMDKVGLPSEMERDMPGLDGDVSSTSQCSRQIEVTEVPDGSTAQVAGR